MNRARAIERSIWCCALGGVSLLPVLGLPAALVAFWQYRSVRRLLAGAWNPADRPLIVGFVLAWVGVVLSIVTLTLVGLAAWAAIDSQPTW